MVNLSKNGHTPAAFRIGGERRLEKVPGSLQHIDNLREWQLDQNTPYNTAQGVFAGGAMGNARTLA